MSGLRKHWALCLILLCAAACSTSPVGASVSTTTATVTTTSTTTVATTATAGTVTTTSTTTAATTATATATATSSSADMETIKFAFNGGGTGLTVVWAVGADYHTLLVDLPWSTEVTVRRNPDESAAATLDLRSRSGTRIPGASCTMIIDGKVVNTNSTSGDDPALERGLLTCGAYLLK